MPISPTSAPRCMDNPKPKTWIVWSLEASGAVLSVGGCGSALSSERSSTIFMAGKLKLMFSQICTWGTLVFWVYVQFLQLQKYYFCFNDLMLWGSKWWIFRPLVPPFVLPAFHGEQLATIDSSHSSIWLGTGCHLWNAGLIRWLLSGKQTWLEVSILSRTTFYKKHFGSLPWYLTKKTYSCLPPNIEWGNKILELEATSLGDKNSLSRSQRI